MRPADITLKFFVAFALMGAGAIPIAVSLGTVVRVFFEAERHRATYLEHFRANAGGTATISLLVVACIIAFAAGVTLAVVAFGRTLDYAQSRSSRRPRALPF